MRRSVIFLGLGACGTVLVALWGCPGLTSISIVSTTCQPVQVGVGENITLMATVKDEGRIPTYSWKVISVDPPPDPRNEVVGSFANANRLEARFTPNREGTFRIRFTAADGVFADSQDCPLITVQGRARVAVRLVSEPRIPIVNAPVALECSDNDGETEAVTFEIEQVLDPLPPSFVTFIPIREGRVAFEVSRPGTYLFSCIGRNADNEESAPATLAVNIGGTAGNTNGNENANGNANSNENGNDNGNANTNENENSNSTVNDNSNDNKR